ncbi:MAG: pyrroline-5-carboxylate reductase [Pseudomonadota bacterium]
MSISEKIGFAGGGRMGEALIKGLLAAGIVKEEQTMVFDSDPSRAEYLKSTYGIRIGSDNRQLAEDCELIVLAVKPQVIAQVLDELRPVVTPGNLMISIAAGIPLQYLESRLPENTRVIRVMPNTPALIGVGMTAVAGGKSVAKTDLETADRIFSAVGKTVVLEERYLDAVTGLSGSGPAYFFAIMEAFIDAGVKMGLSRDVAKALTLQTVLGSVRMALETGIPISGLREMVTSPGGTTIAGLHVMARSGLHGILMDAVESATRRSIELKQETLK